MREPRHLPLLREFCSVRPRTGLRECARALLVAAGLALTVLPVRAGGDALAPRWDRRQQLRGASTAVFHPETGRKTAVLRVGRVGGEYGKRGLLRVAWRREVVFEDLELEVLDSTDWPRIAAAVAQTLRQLGRADVVRVRRFLLRQADGEHRTVRAAAGELSRGGDLQLHDVVLGGGAVPEVRRAGYLLPLAAPIGGLAALVHVPDATP